MTEHIFEIGADYAPIFYRHVEADRYVRLAHNPTRMGSLEAAFVEGLAAGAEPGPGARAAAKRTGLDIERCRRNAAAVDFAFPIAEWRTEADLPLAERQRSSVTGRWKSTSAT